VLQRAPADISLRHRRLRVGRCQAAPVEQYGNLVAGAKLAVGAAPLVDDAENVPLVVRATADRRRCAQRIVFAKRGLGEPLLHRRREFGVGLDSFIEVGIELCHIVVAAPGRRNRNAQVADSLAGLALLGNHLPESLDLRSDRRLQIFVHAVASADLRAFGDFGGMRGGVPSRENCCRNKNGCWNTKKTPIRYHGTDLPSATRICCNRSRARCRDQNATLPPREWIVNPLQRIGYHVWLDATTEIRGNPMLDSHIRHLLDTVFKAPPGTAEPDVAGLRKAAEEAPELLGGVPETSRR